MGSRGLGEGSSIWGRICAMPLSQREDSDSRHRERREIAVALELQLEMWIPQRTRKECMVSLLFRKIFLGSVWSGLR